MRYLVRHDVINWMVWDREKRGPARRSGRRLVGLLKDDADLACTEMNIDSSTAIETEITAPALAVIIRAETDLPWPSGFEVTVHCHADGSWFAKCYSPDPVRNAGLAARIRDITANIKHRYVLKSL